MRQMHAADIKCIVAELQSVIGSRVDTVYQDGPSLLRIRLYGGPSGRAEILLEVGRRIHLTEQRRKAPKTPTSFAMYLRKQLANRPLSSAWQHDFDRIVVLGFGERRLVVELFARGNLVLLDPDSKVMLSMRRAPEGRVSRGTEYAFPQPPPCPFQIKDPQTLRSTLQRKDLVRSLAMDLGLGRLYANELCASAHLDPNLDPARLGDEEARTIIDWIEWMNKATSRPRGFIYGEDQPTEFAPFELESMKEAPKTLADSFNQAADRYYVHGEMMELREQTSSVTDAELKRLEERLEIQRSQLTRLLSESQSHREMGNAIYANFSLLEKILNAIGPKPDHASRLGDTILAEAGMAGGVEKYDPATKTLTVNLAGGRVLLSVRKTLGENAGEHYATAKALEKRAEGDRIAMAKTQRLIEMAHAQAPTAERPREMEAPRRPDWYEKYRWFFSSEGNLVLAGRDMRSNEMLVRRHLEEPDFYVHADVHGAPSTIVKVGRDTGAGPETLKEACAFALMHSSLWRSGVTVGDVYWVRSDQVSKRPTPGEYVARGAFLVRGQRNYLRGLQVRCGIGWFGDRFMCGPLQAVQRRCSPALEITPGDGKKSDIAKQVAKRLGPKHMRIDLDQIIQILPPGRSSLAAIQNQ